MRVPAASIVFNDDDIAEALSLIESSLRSGQLTLGKHGQAFEESFAQRCGRAHAVAVSSGTSAIEIVLRACGIESGEVIVPDNTFFATAAAVVHAGARPVFADTDRDTLAVDVDDVLSRITPQTKAVVVVHIGGIVSPELPRLATECAARGIQLICDAAHAHGATLDGKDASNWGIASTYSFYPTKVMTSGEGGMIVTDDERIADEARVYRDQGKAGFTSNFHTRLGANWRLSEVHAAIGLVQLKRLNEFIERRRQIAAVYDDLLPRETNLTAVPCQRLDSSNFYKYVAYLPAGVDRAALKATMRERFEVGMSGEVYEFPLHAQPVFEPFVSGSYPVSDDVCARQVCLPVSARMTTDDARYVVESLARTISGG
ncbi:MAG: DegT/DnrJ/EryC1/StrS family aminotransferase [Dehalococcoidia bacterium]|nr:DegT/DnrJ/EryC1/StrS family aminotransferase [Dehalococcoidia bacterium]